MRSPLRPLPAAVTRWTATARVLGWLDALAAYLAIWGGAAVALPSASRASLAGGRHRTAGSRALAEVVGSRGSSVCRVALAGGPVLSGGVSTRRLGVFPACPRIILLLCGAHRGVLWQSSSSSCRVFHNDTG